MFQYVVTVMVALMVMQHAVDRYWISSGAGTSSWQKLLFLLFISYPMLTLMLVTLTNNEMAVRRFIYYRLMSMQVGRRGANIEFSGPSGCQPRWCMQNQCAQSTDGDL